MNVSANAPAAVDGSVAEGFERVADVFQQCRADCGSGGAAFAAIYGGRVVVDLWAGRAGAERWRASTRAVLMSTTKGIVVAALARLVDRAQLDVGVQLSQLWPELANGAKRNLTLEHLLTHSSGLITVPQYQDLLTPYGEGWDQTHEIVRRLEGAEPAWTPGSRHGYHGLTFGWLVGEAVRRATGKTTGAIVQDVLAKPLGAEFDLGTPSARHAQVANVVIGEERLADAALARQLRDPQSMAAQMLLAVDGRCVLDTADKVFARPSVLSCELPAINATATARAVALIYSSLVADHADARVRGLSRDTLELFTRERYAGPGATTGHPERWGLGFQRPVPSKPHVPSEWGPNDETFGHNGMGGQIGFADPIAKLGVGFVRSHLSARSPLAAQLIDALYRCIPAREARAVPPLPNAALSR